jgi:hypothetical protein
MTRRTPEEELERIAELGFKLGRQLAAEHPLTLDRQAHFALLMYGAPPLPERRAS